MNVTKYAELLRESGYDKQKSEKLINGFKFGFDLGYRGNTKIQRNAPELEISDRK